MARGRGLSRRCRLLPPQRTGGGTGEGALAVRADRDRRAGVAPASDRPLGAGARAPDRAGQPDERLPGGDGPAGEPLRAGRLRRPEAPRSKWLQRGVRPRAHARGVPDAADQAGRAGRLARERQLRLQGPRLRERREPVGAGRAHEVGEAAAAAQPGADPDRALHPGDRMPVIVIALLCAAIGLVLGLYSPVTIPVAYARYTAVALLAGLDSIFGAFKAYLAGTFEPRVFLSGLLTNMALAGGLTWIGAKLGVDLSIAAIVAFGVRIFNNLGAIRRHYL